MIQSHTKQLTMHFFASPKNSSGELVFVPDENPISCNFESDACPLHQVADDDDQWYRVFANQISLEKGTAKDHTSAQGLYENKTISNVNLHYILTCTFSYLSAQKEI